MTKYFPPVSKLCQAMGTTPSELQEDGKIIGVPANLLRHLIKCALANVEIDPEIYRAQNEDLRAQRQAKALETHYKETGYFEGRVLPTPFDQDYYCRRYKDVFNAIRAKKLGSAIQHYYDQGIDEFRAPSQALERPIADWAKVLETAEKTLSSWAVR
jgi:hypothetical protein